jgi:cytochrome c biogenesis protein
MKLALTLLFVVAILSIIGTILPQGDNVYRSDWVNNPLFDFYDSLGLFNMYYSIWFLLILTLLMVNLSMCITNRLPTTIKHAFRMRVDVKDAFVANQPMSATFAGAGDKGLETAKSLLKGSHYRFHTGETGSVLAQKGRFSGLASLSFHLSFLVICLGAIVGGVFGFKGDVAVADGETVSVKLGTDYELKSYGFKAENEPVYQDGRVVNYKISMFSTDLELFQDGKSIERQTITVNGPLRHKTMPVDPLALEGVNFYQSGYMYDQVTGVPISIIEVSHQPGKTLIYIGFALMMVGITLGLYFPHRRIWLKVGKSGELLMGGRTNRSKLGFQRDFDRAATELRLRMGQEAKADGLG